jgi:putative tricarboxylic transport membrane protein
VNRDAALGGVTLALAVGYYLMAAAIPSSLLADAVGPQGLPRIYAVVLAALSLILLVKSLGRGAVAPEKAGPDASSHAWRVAGLLGIGVIYVIVVPWLGYMLSLAGLIVATTYYQGGTINRRVVAVALSGAFALWLLFVMVLGIPQPAGLWPAFF